MYVVLIGSIADGYANCYAKDVGSVRSCISEWDSAEEFSAAVWWKEVWWTESCVSVLTSTQVG